MCHHSTILVVTLTGNTALRSKLRAASLQMQLGRLPSRPQGKCYCNSGNHGDERL
jgi:hypothetical protein